MGFLRLFLALSVVVFHMPQRSSVWLNASEAVITFFMISGFYMAFIINERFSRLDHWPRRFYFSRICRLFPTYFVVLALGVLWLAASSASTVFTSNLGLGFARQLVLILLNMFILGQDVFMMLMVLIRDGLHGPLQDSAANLFGRGFFTEQYLIIGQAWTLGTELIFYALAPFVVTRVSRIMCLLALSIGVRVLFQWQDTSFTPIVWGYFFFPATMCFFCLGALGYFGFKKIEKFARAKTFGLICGAILWLWLIVQIRHGGAFNAGEDFDTFAHWVYYAGFAVTIPFLFLVTKNSKFDRLVGELSYPVYLVHGFVIGVVISKGKWLTEIFGLESVIFAFSIGIAAILYLIIERPVNRIRQHIEKASPAALNKNFVVATGCILVASVITAACLQFLAPRSLPPALKQVMGNYNIVKYKEQYDAVPHGRPFDWEKDNVSSLPGVFVADSEAKAIALLRKSDGFIPAGHPELTKVIGRYNIVRFDGRYFAIPHGTAVDWANDKVADISGVFVADSEDKIAAMVPSSPVLVEVAGRYNIVQFNGRYFALPQGLAVNWEKDKVADLPGVFVADSQDDVMRKLPRTQSQNKQN